MAILQRLKKSIWNRYQYWKIRRQIPDNQYARYIQQSGISCNSLQWNEAKKALQIDGLDIDITREKNGFILTPFNQVNELLFWKDTLNAAFYQEGSELYVKMQDVVLNLQTNQEISIIHEIFLEEMYHFEAHRPFIALDIGMNVGFSSLYFARQPLCKKVYSFEPFKPTYEQGVRNFSNNPAFKDKITPFNFGISNRDEVLEIDYAPSIRGSMSIDYWPGYGENVQGIQKERIEIRDIKKVLAELNIGKDKELMVVAKIDCEGSEYAVIEELAQSGLLSSIDIIMMEWHLKGHQLLTGPMIAAGFECFCLKLSGFDNQYGLIYATRTGKEKSM